MRIPIVYTTLSVADRPTGRTGVQDARRWGERCLQRAAKRAGAPGPPPRRRPDAAPALSEGWFGSVTGTEGLVAAAVGSRPLGLDAEHLGRERWQAAHDYFESSQPGELARFGGHEREQVLGLWTAKEAVLKLDGCGLAGLPMCRFVERMTDGALALELGQESFRVHSFVVGSHVLSLAQRASSEQAISLEDFDG